MEDLFTMMESLKATAPEWVRVIPMGQVELADREPFTVDRESLERIVEAWRKRGIDLVVDYEHQSVSGGEAPAAGWVKDLEVRDDGLWARIDWTDRARRMIEGREYRYYSPVVTVTKRDRRVSGLHSIAITNTPAINHLQPLAASLVPLAAVTEADRAKQQERSKRYGIGIKPGGHVTKPSEWEDVPDDLFADPVNYRYPMPDWDQTRAAWAYWNKPANRKQYTEEEIEIITERIKRRGRAFGRELRSAMEEAKMETIDQIREVLGVAEADDLVSHVRIMKDDLDSRSREVESLKEELSRLRSEAAKAAVPLPLSAALDLPPTATVDEALSRLEALRAQVEDGAEAKAKLQSLREELRRKEAERLVIEAVRSGRTTEAELAKADGRLLKMAYDDPETFRAIMESRPEGFMAPVGSRFSLSKASGRVALDDLDQAIIASLGISEDDYLKAKASMINNGR